MRGRKAVLILGLAIIVVGTAVWVRSAGLDPRPGPLGDPASLQSDAGYSSAGGPMPVGRPFTYGMIWVRNSSDFSATVDGITPQGGVWPPGMRLVGVYADPHSCFPAGLVRSIPIDTSCLQPLEGFATPPNTPKGEGVSILLELQVDRPGRYSVHGFDLHYHVGPFHYSSLYMIGLGVCAPVEDYPNGCPGPL